MSKSNEPIWWSLFGAGGVVAAFFIPILLVITGLAIPLGWAGDAPFAYERIHGAVAHPLTRLCLFGLIALPLFHWAHRFRYTLIDLGLRSARTGITIGCYGSAIAGTLIAAIVLWRF